MAEEQKGKAAREEDVNEEAPPHRLTENEQRVGQRENEPRNGESPDEPPREEPPTPDEAEVAPEEEYRLVPNPSGQAGVPWEELRKATQPDENETPEERQWDDRGASEPQQIDHPKQTWDELPEDTEPPEEKISTP